MANGQTKTFEIGLAMAGAISAGAYSGGVFDFLLQALDEWKKAKESKLPDIPNHQAVIKVISGASAGAITGAIGTVAFANGLQPQPFDNPKGPQKYRCMLPKLYEAWVIKPRLVSAKLNSTDLLSLEDLKAEKNSPTVKSILNSVLLDQIKDGALSPSLQAAAPIPVPYFARDLHVYLTLSNLRGIPYSIEFQGGGYGMQSHGDRVHYIVNGLGTEGTPSPWAGKDPGRAIGVSGLFGAGAPTKDWQNFALAAVASGAFPVGLAPREIRTRTDEYTRYLPIDMPKLDYTKPNWPPPWWQDKTRDFNFLCVDGGVINNEPFEYARYTLMVDPPNSNDRDGTTADRAVVMIDPFPEPPSFAGDGKPAADVVSVVSALFPALVNQARFKPSELTDALNPDVFSRFLIAPVRNIRTNGKTKEALYAIACGLLSGFGGFLDEEFRKHDFQLGRRNCQRFLKDVFALPKNNSIIQQWPAGARANPQFQTETRTGGQSLFCIIPLFGSALDEVVLPPWPRISQDDFATLQKRLKTRIEAVVPIIINRQTNSWWLRGALYVAAKLSEGRILKFAQYAILSDLVRRDQVAGWELPQQPDPHDPQDVRKVLAELANPSYDYRTPEGIARATGLKVDDVRSILSFLERQTGRPYLVWWSDVDGRPIYTLDSRKPPTFWRLPVVRSIDDLLNAPVID